LKLQSFLGESSLFLKRKLVSTFQKKAQSFFKKSSKLFKKILKLLTKESSKLLKRKYKSFERINSNLPNSNSFSYMKSRRFWAEEDANCKHYRNNPTNDARCLSANKCTQKIHKENSDRNHQLEK
jgi:hypothetical protein